MISLPSSTLSSTEAEPCVFLARQVYSPRLSELRLLITELLIDLSSC